MVTISTIANSATMIFKMGIFVEIISFVVIFKVDQFNHESLDFGRGHGRIFEHLNMIIVKLGLGHGQKYLAT